MASHPVSEKSECMVFIERRKVGKRDIWKINARAEERE